MNLKPKKSLGQNFLKSERALNKIIESGEVGPDDLILEVGPGKGALTEKILEAGASVLAIEKDSDLINFLNEKFSKNIVSGQLKIINEDILKFDEKNCVILQGKNYKVIANIPYYITGEIIRKFLTTENHPKTMVLLVQKEVAERIVANDKKESILSVSVKAYCDPVFVETVKAGSFVPMPEVDSAIIKFENINKTNFANLDEKLFFEVIKTGFSSKRKMLKGNLKNKFGATLIEKVFEELKFDAKIRAENLKVGDWILLVNKITG